MTKFSNTIVAKWKRVCVKTGVNSTRKAPSGNLSFVSTVAEKAVT